MCRFISFSAATFSCAFVAQASLKLLLQLGLDACFFLFAAAMPPVFFAMQPAMLQPEPEPEEEPQLQVFEPLAGDPAAAAEPQ